MKSIEDCSIGGGFEFQKSSTSHHRTPLGKPTPSKWDDAQKWLVNLSGGDRNKAKAKPKASPRNSNADDRRLIAPAPKDYWSGEEEAGDGCPAGSSLGVSNNQCDVETKNVDWAESVWQDDKQVINSPESIVRSICLRDMGTEMTPIASQEPSRAATPVKAGNAESRNHRSSRSSTPVRCLNELQMGVQGQSATPRVERSSWAGTGRSESKAEAETECGGDARRSNCKGEEAKVVNKSNDGQSKKKMSNPLEARAAAWDEAERAKYMARYKREEVKIQTWENHQKQKAELEYAKVEAKVDRLKAGAKEEYNNKVAAAHREAEAKRANAEAKLNHKLRTTSQRAEYIRTSGHLPSNKLLPSASWWWCCCCHGGRG